MAGPLYCDASDLYGYGIPRGSLPWPARLVASVSAGVNAIELDGHGLEADDPVTFRAEAGGTLPAPLVAGTTYYAQPTSESWFGVSATAGGAVIDLTTAGSCVLVIAAPPEEKARRWASRMLDDMLPAHCVPLTAPYPEIIRATAAELAAGKLANLTGSATKSIGDMLDAAQKRIDRWARGVPVRGEVVPTSAARATSASAQARDQRGWTRYGGLR